MKRNLIIVVIVLILLVSGYIVYVKFFKSNLPTGSKSDLQAKLNQLQYQLMNDKKAGKDTSALQSDIERYAQAVAKSSFSGTIYA